MLERVGHEREREVGDERWRIRRGKIGKTMYLHGRYRTNYYVFAYE